MGLLWFGNSKKKQLLELQKLVLENSPNKLIMTKQELISSALQTINRLLKICDDCAQLVDTTTKPEVFFSRFDLLLEHCSTLKKFEPHIPFTNAPSALLNKLQTNRQEYIRDFLLRYHKSIVIQADALKTARGKANRYKMFSESLEPYLHYMDSNNIQFIQKNSSFE